ncbi:MAG: hybrid sensor histidine kinase/response regulator [Verrucomicrobia bacterium]|nr:hybrid sensor histidine kinase/response regulator [Verrucomicrobiota bacterium]
MLVVDDDPVNIAVVSGLLGPEGYELAEAETGESALARCEDFKPDLVVMDVRLPGIDGFETCRRIQLRYGTDSPPVIFVTASKTDDDIIAGFEAGGVDYLTKPVSEREALARIRTHLANRLLVRKLGQTLNHKNQLLGMAAHDLRNPLSTIRGMSELLNEGVMGTLTSEQAEVISMFRDTSAHMLAMVNELLDVAVIEAGQLKLSPTHTDLAEVVAKSVHLNAINAAQKKTVIQFEHNGPPAFAMIDAAKIRQVIDNLLGNAIKYSPLGSTITASLHQESGHITVAVRDQGPGIPEQERSRLFKAFSTLSVKSTAGEKSTGLGLAICRRIVEAHLGSISALNLPERGCEFSFVIPIEGVNSRTPFSIE